MEKVRIIRLKVRIITTIPNPAGEAQDTMSSLVGNGVDVVCPELCGDQEVLSVHLLCPPHSRLL